MCGRYATTRTGPELELEFTATLNHRFTETAPNHNVAPTTRASIVLERDDEHGHRTREVATARWGLVPGWAKDPKIGARLINARSETVAEKPSFRSAFARRRAVIPVDGYYEWYKPTATDDTPTPPSQPFFLSASGGLSLAGLHESWRDPTGEWWLTFTILTTAAVGAEGRIHDRAPLIVPPAHLDHWLATEPWPEAVAHLEPATPGRLAAWPVSRRVNSVRNNGPALVAPLPAE